MNAKKILCPVDFSACSNVAFRHAAEFARLTHAKLVIANVTPPPPAFVSGYAGYGSLASPPPEPDPRLDEMQVADVGVELERVHLVGIEGEAIVKHAEQTGCDLIVLGTHGYGGLTRLLLGSVTDYVVRHAKCPVFVVKDTYRENQENTQDSVVVA